MFPNLFFQSVDPHCTLFAIFGEIDPVAQIVVYETHKSRPLELPVKLLHDLFLHLLELLRSVIAACIFLVTREIGYMFVELNGFGRNYEAASTHKLDVFVAVAFIG